MYLVTFCYWTLVQCGNTFTFLSFPSSLCKKICFIKLIFLYDETWWNVMAFSTFKTPKTSELAASTWTSYSITVKILLEYMWCVRTESRYVCTLANFYPAQASTGAFFRVKALVHAEGKMVKLLKQGIKTIKVTTTKMSCYSVLLLLGLKTQRPLDAAAVRLGSTILP